MTGNLLGIRIGHICTHSVEEHFFPANPIFYPPSSRGYSDVFVRLLRLARQCQLSFVTDPLQETSHQVFWQETITCPPPLRPARMWSVTAMSLFGSSWRGHCTKDMNPRVMPDFSITSGISQNRGNSPLRNSARQTARMRARRLGL